MRIIILYFFFLFFSIIKIDFIYGAPPTAPTFLVANALNSKVNLNWSASVGVGTITYIVQRTNNINRGDYKNIVTGLTTTSFTDSTTTNDQAYFYRVYAQNSGGLSPSSNEIKGIPIAPPSIPSALNVTTTTDGKVGLTWYKSNGHVNGPITYTISRAPTSTLIYSDIATVSTLTYKDATAVTGITYSYIVRANNYAGSSTKSLPVSIKTGISTAPASPTDVIATVVNNNKVELSWKASITGGSITYSIYRSIYPNFSTYVTLTTGLTKLSFVDSTIPTKGVTYYYTIKAVNSSGISLFSNIPVISVGTANVLFKTNFGNGSDVILGSPSSIIAQQAWQKFSGVDSETGYGFPFIAGLGSGSEMILQLIGPYNYNKVVLNSSNVNTYFGNKIQSVIGPKGNLVRELYLNLIQKDEPIGEAGSQVPFLINRPWTIGDTGDVYISYWYKFPDNLIDKLDPLISGGNWRTLFEWKTGGYKDSYKGDYRMATTVLKGKDGTLHWISKWDNIANMDSRDFNKDGSPWVAKTYWSETNFTVPVPVGKWFKFEVFWHRSTASDGRYWVAINGQTLFNHTGPNMGDYSLPVNRIMINNAYAGGAGPVEGHLTDLNIWNGYPCGFGISCK